MNDPVNVVLAFAVLLAGLVCTVVGLGLIWIAVAGLLNG